MLDTQRCTHTCMLGYCEAHKDTVIYTRDMQMKRGLLLQKRG